jgi:prepilin-type N-terminal cleavage/methylation domain-containing protein
MNQGKRGFTLVELLVVIAILAILAAVVVVVLNPAELLAQARDSQRISDLGQVSSAIALFLSDVSDISGNMDNGPFSTVSSTCGFSVSCTVRNVYTVDKLGWAAVDFTKISGGSPLSVLPRDPTNNATYQYAYMGNKASATFELDARLESAKFRDKMVNDGGNKNTCSTYTESTCYYEVGNDPGLDL